MSYRGRFGVRRLAVIGAAVALGSGVGSVGLLSVAAPPVYAMSTGTCSESGTTTVTVTCTKGSGTWTPPAGLTSVAVDVEGAGGTQGLSGGSAGTGGSSITTLAVSSTNTYTVLVGSQGGGGAGGFNGFSSGGSGGGRSEIDLGTSCASSTCRLVVAGGGGGSGDYSSSGNGGNGGGSTGSAGGDGPSFCPGGGTPAGGGQPGTDTGPGTPGAAGTGNGCVNGSGGSGGSGSSGGSGGSGSGAGSGGGGGGGGDGFFGGGGGGGGAVSPGGGGGGGSGHLDNATTTGGSTGPGTNTGDGSVTITYPGPNQAPAITSADTTTFTVGTSGSFSVTATGSPAPTFSEIGALPTGVTLNPTSGVLSGPPATGTAGSYPITITASNGVSPDATQAFTLLVNQAPAITSANTATFTVGKSGSFSVTATGSPTPSLSEIGALPGGVTFTDNHNGTATLAGTPKPLTAGTYILPITAHNGVSPDAAQTFTLVVVQPGQVNVATAKGSNVGCTVTWSGHSIGAIGSYEAFTFTSTPASSPSSVGPANAAHGVHPGATVTSVEHLTPGTMSASLVFHAVNNYGQQQTINLTIPTPGC